MQGSPSGRRKSFSEVVANTKATGRLFFAGLLLFGFLGAAGCEDVKPLTPEEQSLVSAWSVKDRIEHAYAEMSVDNVLNTLSPGLAASPDTRTHLSTLFGMFRSVDLHLTMDSGRIDTTAHTVHFRAHWTMTGIPKTKAGRYFQTGECRLVVSIRKAPLPARIQEIAGDTFLAAPGKLSPGQ